RYYSFHMFFFFNVHATSQLFTHSLHDALPIYRCCCRVTRHSRKNRLHRQSWFVLCSESVCRRVFRKGHHAAFSSGEQSRHSEYRSEEHTSELQSRGHLVCRLLFEKKKT